MTRFPWVESSSERENPVFCWILIDEIRVVGSWQTVRHFKLGADDIHLRLYCTVMYAAPSHLMRKDRFP
jgi:hypothetical protein